MNYKTGRMCVCLSMRCQHFQNPQDLRPLGQCRWHLASVFCGSWDKNSRKQNFEFWSRRHTWPPGT